ncbi:MAG: SpoIID/LytB domain-containing protein [Oscillospiraceae bacterium]|nr:SpoIID/LytB domain-containing protein [Candidatus Equicaccousia limihippi]
MKALYFAFLVILFFTMLLVPFLVCGTGSSAVAVSTGADSGSFAVYISSQNEIKNITAQDYVLGVLGANCDKNSPAQSIKAQAVCAYTLALYYSEHSGDKNYDLEDIYDGYADISSQKEKWGADYDKTVENFKKIINEVEGQYLACNGKPILALCHAVSSGKTENAKDILGEDLPYLVSCDSAGDLYCPTLETKKTVPLSELKNLMSSFGKISDTPDLKLGKTASGAVKTVSLYGVSAKGEEIKNALSLPSLCFNITLGEKDATVTALGSGSLLGLSRYGANYMAQKGADYTEILSNYFKNCALQKR